MTTRRTGVTADLRHAFLHTTIGTLLAVRWGTALAGLYFPEHTYPPTPAMLGERVAPSGNRLRRGDDDFLFTVGEQLREYLAGNRRAFDLPLRTAGNEFSEEVWTMLRQIPYGQVTTYGALARRLGSAGLAQRVGQAVGRNPVSIVIPCHRVLGADGSLTGYAGGLDRKRALLDIEEPPEARAARLF
ncbi:methylated-DNA--[protein]-cysteine S-methyltransferase [Pseudactinotalea sp. Z1739]|uniref:methylated-DNA--[protein]-cysteine S-methyltransferase n=1 Tax=Pseudactinotalea sp. Z1739 TaxID=3413028 RepID=UPI003C7DAF8D